MTFKTVTESIRIAAEPGRVWDALTDPQAGDRWRNAHFKTGWRVGDPFEIEAVIGTKRYRDKGRLIAVEPPALLRYAYWSRVSGLPDHPESWSTITMTLRTDGEVTILTVDQQVPPSPPRSGPGWETGEDTGWKHAAFYWRSALAMLKRTVEK
ncbi:SRPBCC domain-containing protein [Bradyrhizobium sp. CB1717]|uniref:SRPBCC family protein n=1 Tax=Bradyrhizobium sp. CB1717 TaxID=3039154 RepID=UPI0024B09C37|nr:SRPBCC domain-containing protein [Bradyrhizobium sp. CB1717]WFU24136.1 SRPBCC domain-containing protein [Bradyrhizobium sp. CB1717]